MNQKTSGQLYNLQARGDFRISAETNGFFRVGYNNQHWNGQYQLQAADTEIPDVAAGLNFDLGDHGAVAVRAFYARESFRNENVSVLSRLHRSYRTSIAPRPTTPASPRSGRRASTV